MKIKRTIIAGLIMLTAVVASVISSEMVWAVPTDHNQFNGNSAVSIERTIEDPINHVRTSFSYNVTASQAPTGVSAPAISPGSVTFTGSEPTDACIQYGSISFNANYPDVGTYVYTITEVSNNPSFPADTSHSYTVLVDVRYPTTNNIPDNDYHYITIIVKDDGTKINDGTLSFSSEPIYAEVSIDAGVRGSMAKKDLCFPYLVKIPAHSPAVAGGDSFDYSISNEDAGASVCSENTGIINADTVTTVYLKHGDTLSLTLPIGARYQVARALDIESGTVQAEYAMTIDDAALDQRSGMNTTSLEDDTNFEYKTAVADSEDPENSVSIIRTRDEQAPMGIFTAVWVWIILAIAAIISIVLIFRKTTKKEQHLIAE